MAELIAQGMQQDRRWRRRLPDGLTIVVGRGVPDWDVPWDPFISRKHAQLTLRDNFLLVEQVPTAANPIFYQGRESNQFTLRPGEHFVIGETTFTLAEEHISAISNEPRPVQERAISPHELAEMPFRDAPHRIDVLSRLPDVIARAANEDELFHRIVDMLLAGIRRAEAAAVVSTAVPVEDRSPVQILHWDRRLTQKGEFRPSQRLVREAVRRQQPILHIWQAGEKVEPTFTAQGNFDWALCSPVRSEACKGWAFYLAGRLAGESASTLLAPWEQNDLGDDLKFTELVTSILGSLRQVQLLQRKQALLSPFFSPAVLRTFSDADPETVLQPQETEVTVLFCDLRGFSRQSERQAENLKALLERVSQALSVMTQNIFEQGGVVADFQGDAALGFWGWPLAQPDKVRRAARAALDIRGTFEVSSRRAEHALADFRAGIGMATGPAVAGKIGTPEQAKVGVFGPVVNVASRLEGLTKILHAPVLLDETTARVVRERLAPDVGRCRRLLKVRLYGMDQPLVVSELLPPAAAFPLLTDEHIAAYESAFDAFLAGDWNRAYELLHHVPPQDRGKDVITGYIIQHDHTPPANWDGVIPIERKS